MNSKIFNLFIFIVGSFFHVDVFSMGMGVETFAAAMQVVENSYALNSKAPKNKEETQVVLRDLNAQLLQINTQLENVNKIMGTLKYGTSHFEYGDLQFLEVGRNAASVSAVAESVNSTHSEIHDALVRRDETARGIRSKIK